MKSTSRGRTLPYALPNKHICLFSQISDFFTAFLHKLSKMNIHFLCIECMQDFLSPETIAFQLIVVGMYVCNHLFSDSAVRIFLKFCILLHHYVWKKMARIKI